MTLFLRGITEKHQEFDAHQLLVTTISTKTMLDAVPDIVLLTFCALGICVSYITYGFILEECFGRDNTIGSVTTFVLITQSITNVLVARLLISIVPHKSSCSSTTDASNGSLNHRLLIKTSVCFAAAMNATNQSLSYVSYPTAVLAKSSKLIPTMIMSAWVDSKPFQIDEIVGAIMITSGVVLFNLSRTGLIGKNDAKQSSSLSSSSSSSSPASQHQDSALGYALLFLSLFMDGLLASCQSLLKAQGKSKYRPPSAMETMMYINLYSIMFLFPLALWTGQLQRGIRMILSHGSDLIQFTTLSLTMSFLSTLVLLNLTAAFGQIFVSITIHNFSPSICTTITTTRKFLSIVFSVHRFGHVFTPLQWSSVFIVFYGLRLEMKCAHHDHQQQQLQQTAEKVKRA